MKIASKMQERRNVGKFKKVVSYQKEKKKCCTDIVPNKMIGHQRFYTTRVSQHDSFFFFLRGQTTRFRIVTFSTCRQNKRTPYRKYNAHIFLIPSCKTKQLARGHVDAPKAHTYVLM